jgi:enoyl-CoA hydratase
VNFETLQFEVTDAIGVITLNRPETINALNQTMIAELEKAFDILDQDETINMNLGVASLEQALQIENRNQAFMITALKAGLIPPDKK